MKTKEFYLIPWRVHIIDPCSATLAKIVAETETETEAIAEAFRQLPANSVLRPSLCEGGLTVDCRRIPSETFARYQAVLLEDMLGDNTDSCFLETEKILAEVDAIMMEQGTEETDALLYELMKQEAEEDAKAIAKGILGQHAPPEEEGN